MQEYTINGNTGIKNIVVGTLEEAKAKADETASYTQRDIDIELAGEVVATRKWWGTEFDPSLYEEQPDIIQFGKTGYYDEWQ